MSLENDIMKLLKAEGLKLNETIRDALVEFVEIVNEENEEGIEDADEDNDEE